MNRHGGKEQFGMEVLIWDLNSSYKGAGRMKRRAE